MLVRVLQATIGFLLTGDKMESLRNVIFIILAAVVIKNALIWMAGQIGAQLQDYVSRDMRTNSTRTCYGYLSGGLRETR